MNLLAFDTSTEACSAALSLDGEIFFRYELAPRRHTDLVLPMIDQIMHEAGLALSQLDAIAFGRGPGAFTGVRIATGIAQGLAYSTNIPLVSVSSLATIAQSVTAKSKIILPAIDARMGEIYLGYYRSGNVVEPIDDEVVIKPEEINATIKENCYGAGTGWRTYANTLQQKFSGRLDGFSADIYPDARHMLPLASRDFQQGKILQPAQAAPAYLRDRVTG